MKLFFQYVYLEMKRMFLSFPRILFGSMFLLILLTGIFAFCQQNSMQERKNNTIHIGIVAQEDEPFIDWMVSAVSNMKNMADSCHFERIDEQTAKQKLASGEIAIAFFIPQNYVASIINGENKHLSIRMGNGQTTIISFLFKQLSEAASSFILNSEAGIYSMQEYYDLHNLPQKAEDELELNLQYIKDIAGLEKGIRTETIDTKKNYPLASQYMISGFVLFLLLWGLTAGKLLVPPKKAFQNQLAIAGISKNRQILARGLSFLSASLANYLVFFLLISLGMKFTGFAIQDTIISDINGLWQFAACCLPLLLFSTVTIQLVYEIADDTISGILFLFFGVLLLAFCSGCFYPLDYLPDTLQKLAPKLPLYPACQYGLAILHQTFDLTAFLALIVYSALFLFLMAMNRTLKQNSISDLSMLHRIKPEKRKKMQPLITCFILWCKRFLKRPLFLFTLLLMPLSVIFLQNCHTKEDAVIHVALYFPEKDADQTAENLTKKMISLSNSAIKFYKSRTPKALKSDVASGKAACGYILPKNLDAKLQGFVATPAPFIQAIRPEEDMRTRIVDEIVLSKLFQPLSYYRLTYYLSGKKDISSEETWIYDTYQKHNSSELLFHFEYANGDGNTLLNDSHANFMLLPIRGVVSIMILLCCLTGGLFRYSDKSGILPLMDTRKRKLCNLLSLLIPGLFAGITGLITIKMTGTMTTPAAEIPAMLLYILCCMSLANLLYIFCSHQEFYLAAIPVVVIGSLIFSPVFINLENLIPGTRFISCLIPTTHYLAAIHTSSSMISSFSPIVSSSVFLICSTTSAALYSRIKG